MKEWEILLQLEYEWRVFRSYRKGLNWLVKKGMKLSSPISCKINKKVNHHCAKLTKLKKLYEELTGREIVYYKYDEM